MTKQSSWNEHMQLIWMNLEPRTEKLGTQKKTRRSTWESDKKRAASNNTHLQTHPEPWKKMFIPDANTKSNSIESKLSAPRFSS